jgi:hypothetical protein
VTAQGIPAGHPFDSSVRDPLANPANVAGQTTSRPRLRDRRDCRRSRHGALGIGRRNLEEVRHRRGVGLERLPTDERACRTQRRHRDRGRRPSHAVGSGQFPTSIPVKNACVERHEWSTLRGDSSRREVIVPSTSSPASLRDPASPSSSTLSVRRTLQPTLALAPLRERTGAGGQRWRSARAETKTTRALRRPRRPPFHERADGRGDVLARRCPTLSVAAKAEFGTRRHRAEYAEVYGCALRSHSLGAASSTWGCRGMLGSYCC